MYTLGSYAYILKEDITTDGDRGEKDIIESVPTFGPNVCKTKKLYWRYSSIHSEEIQTVTAWLHNGKQYTWSAKSMLTLLAMTHVFEGHEGLN